MPFWTHLLIRIHHIWVLSVWLQLDKKAVLKILNPGSFHSLQHLGLEISVFSPDGEFGGYDTILDSSTCEAPSYLVFTCVFC